MQLQAKLMPSQIKSLIHSFFILFLLIGTQTVYANSGRAFSINGSATINDEPLTLSHEIKEGDVIKTGEGSSVKIIMKDKTVLDLNENTSFKVTKYAYKEEAPEEASSSFSLLEGTFRYISGLIAKKDPEKVKFSAGTATIGVRGTLTTVNFDGTEVSASSSIGATEIKFADGTSIKITAGQTGSFNFSTGQSSVGKSTTADTIGAAALAIAADPAKAAEKLEGMSDAEKTLVMAAIMNNAKKLGVDSSKLTTIVSNAVAANPTMAAGLAYVAGALSNSKATTTALTSAITDNVKDLTPEQKAAIEAASDKGAKLEVAPAKNANGEPIFALREAIPGEGDETVPKAKAPVTGSGSPLTTEEFITINSDS